MKINIRQKENNFKNEFEIFYNNELKYIAKVPSVSIDNPIKTDDIREIKDSKVIKKILEKYLIVKYSYNFVNILVKMLEVDEKLRPDFIELENDFFYK